MNVGARGVIRVDDQHGAAARFPSRRERVEIHLPAPVVNQRVRENLNIIQSTQKIEERIARLWRQNAVTGVREEPEHERVRFAGAGGQKDLVRIKLDPPLGVILRDRFPGREQAARVRLVSERATIAERGKNLFGINREPAPGGIRFRQVQDRHASLAAVAHEFGKTIGIKRPAGARGEHHLDSILYSEMKRA